MKVKPNIGWGKRYGSVNSAYRIYGYRKDPKGSGISEYCFQKCTKEHEMFYLKEKLPNICSLLEETSQRIALRLVHKLAMEAIKETSGYKSITDKGCATAMSIGKIFWSKSYTDHDLHLTNMTVLAPECNDKDEAPESKNKDEEIIYCFFPPTYQVAVCIRSGDVILFNPKIMHSCSNWRYSSSCIISAYVSGKNVLCDDSTKFDTNH